MSLFLPRLTDGAAKIDSLERDNLSMKIPTTLCLGFLVTIITLRDPRFVSVSSLNEQYVEEKSSTISFENQEIETTN